MDDAVQAITMAFAVLVFVIALSLAMLLIKQATNTSELLVQYSDLTAFYDNIQLDNNNGIAETERVVGLDTVIPTLYRYYKENFCVKIYDGSELLQIPRWIPGTFDIVDLFCYLMAIWLGYKYICFINRLI